MPIAPLCITIVYIIISIAQVYSRLFSLQWLRYITKPLLMVIMLLVLLSWQLSAHFTVVGVLLFITLGMGWLGDLALLKNSRQFLMVGGIFFGLGHMATVCTGIYLLGSLPYIKVQFPLLKIIIPTLILVISAFMFHKYKSQNPNILGSVGQYISIYLGILTSMVVTLNLLNILYVSPYLLCAAIGAITFYLSDWSIISAEFKGTTPLTSGLWMALYTIGQYAITVGIYLFSLQLGTAML